MTLAEAELSTRLAALVGPESVRGPMLSAYDALLLRLMHYRFSGGKNTFTVRVTRRIGQVTNHVLLNFFGRIESKHSQIAKVELDNFLAFVFHLTRRIHDGATNVIEHVCQLGRFLNGSHKASGNRDHRAKPII